MVARRTNVSTASRTTALRALPLHEDAPKTGLKKARAKSSYDHDDVAQDIDFEYGFGDTVDELEDEEDEHEDQRSVLDDSVKQYLKKLGLTLFSRQPRS